MRSPCGLMMLRVRDADLARTRCVFGGFGARNSSRVVNWGKEPAAARCEFLFFFRVISCEIVLGKYGWV